MTYILYNPLANGGHGYRGVKKIRASLGGERPIVRNVTRLHIPAFLAGLGAEDRVIVCGGDGTLNFFINAIDGGELAVPVYMWQFGTGNDFLRDAAEGGEPQMVLLNEHIKNMPCAEVQGQRIRFANGCSCGVDALVCEMMDEQRRLHKSRKANYTALAVSAIFRRYRPMSGRVTVDGETREYKNLWMAAAMNGRYQGGGMKFAPDQDRNSDLMCCMVWHGTSALGTLIRFPSVIPGKHVRYKNICDIRFGREIRVELDGTAAAQLDGEVVSGVTGFTARKGLDA